MSAKSSLVMEGVFIRKSPILHLNVKIITNLKEYGIK